MTLKDTSVEKIESTDGNVTLENTDVGTGGLSVKAETKTATLTVDTETEVKGTTTLEGAAEDKQAVLHVKDDKTLKTENITANEHVTIYVGDEQTTGTLVVDTEGDLDGAIVSFDPAWKDGVAIEGASVGVFEAFKDDGIDGKFMVGRNSYLVIGDTDTTWATQTFEKSGLTWGENAVTAALFLNQPQKLSDIGAVAVDGTMTHDNYNGNAGAGNTAIFADNSLLVVNAANLKDDTAALAATTGSLTVADTAKLLISGATNGTTVTVVSGFTTNTGTTTEGWGIADATKNLLTDSDVVKIASSAFDAAKGTYTVTLGSSASENPYLTPQGNALLTEFGEKDYSTNDANHANKGVAYIARIVNTTAYLGNDTQAKARALEDPQKMALSGATNKAGMGAAITAASATGARNSASGMNTSGQRPTSVSLDASGDVGLNAGNAMKNGVGVWLMPLYKWSNVSGVESGGFDSGYTSGLGGITVGIDYTMQDAFRLGLALNVGTGYSSSTGSANATNNNFDFWGLSLYAAYQKENFGLTFDLGYSGIYNDMTQETDARLQWGSNKAEALTDVFTVGLTAEYTISLDVLDITPHVGVRYMGATTHGYDVEGQGGTVASIDADHQSVWYFPVGVTFSNDIDMENGWTFTPKLDIGFVAAAGDLKANSSARTADFNTMTEYSMQTVDGFAFSGGLGFEIGNENVKFGLDYNLQASEHETGHMIHGTFRYEF